MDMGDVAARLEVEIKGDVSPKGSNILFEIAHRASFMFWAKDGSYRADMVWDRGGRHVWNPIEMWSADELARRIDGARKVMKTGYLRVTARVGVGPCEKTWGESEAFLARFDRDTITVEAHYNTDPELRFISTEGFLAWVFDSFKDGAEEIQRSFNAAHDYARGDYARQHTERARASAGIGEEIA